MIVGDLDLSRTLIGSDEADAPLVVDADAVLTCAVAAQRLEAVRRREAQVRESDGGDDSLKPHARSTPDVRRQPPDRQTAEDAFGVLVRESIHTPYVNASG